MCVRLLTSFLALSASATAAPIKVSDEEEVNRQCAADAYCFTGTAWKEGNDCAPPDQYCCPSTAGLLGTANVLCNNLNDNDDNHVTISVPVSVLNGAKIG